MKNIQEKLSNIRNIDECIKMSSTTCEYEVIDEGLKDLFNIVKEKFKNIKDAKIVKFAKSIAVKIGKLFWSTDDKGDIAPAISPVTTGSAYKERLINASNTFVYLHKAAADVVGLRTVPDSALKLYGSGDSREYWRAILEGIDNGAVNMINEVKLSHDDPQAKYNTIVDDEELKHVLLTLAKDALQCDPDDPPSTVLIWGAPGIGKTAVLKSVVKSLSAHFNKNFNLITKTLSTETADSFFLPKYIETDMGAKAIDVPKTWLPVYRVTGNHEIDKNSSDACGYGVLFIDELSRMKPEVQNVALGLLNEREFNGYKVGAGWIIISASNRPEDETSGQTMLGNAAASRLLQYYYEPTFKTWRKWAEQQGYMSPIFLDWMELEDETIGGAKFYYYDTNEDPDSTSDTRLICNPRTWAKAMRNLANFANTARDENFDLFDIPEDTIRKHLNAAVPGVAVDSLWSFLSLIRSLSGGDNSGVKMNKLIKNIWEESGSMLVPKISKMKEEDILHVQFPVCQIAMSYHKKTLPTAAEFVSLANCLAKCGSENLTLTMLSLFTDIFMKCSESETHELAEYKLILAAMMKGAKESPESNMTRTLLTILNGSEISAWFKRWGLPVIPASAFKPYETGGDGNYSMKGGQKVPNPSYWANDPKINKVIDEFIDKYNFHEGLSILSKFDKFKKAFNVALGGASIG